MAAGQCTVYNGAYEELMDSANTQWDDATAGAFMWVLAYDAYIPNIAHSTVNDLGVAGTGWISTGDGAPINITTRAVTVSATPNITGLVSDTADFDPGALGVTITNAKYLVCVRPVVAGTVATTSRLIFYHALDTITTVSSINDIFNITMPTGGWITFTQ